MKKRFAFPSLAALTLVACTSSQQDAVEVDLSTAEARQVGEGRVEDLQA